jgi:hypothetical protein
VNIENGGHGVSLGFWRPHGPFFAGDRLTRAPRERNAPVLPHDKNSRLALDIADGTDIHADHSGCSTHSNEDEIMVDTPPPAPAKRGRKPATASTASKARKPAAAASNKTQTVKRAVNRAAAATAGAASAAGAKISESVDWKAQADQIKTQAGKVARNAAGVAKDKTGSAMQGLAKLITDTASTVDSKLGPQYGDYARSAAEAVAGAADTLDAADIDQLIEEARTFVRKSPAVAIGAAAIAGFVLMRLAKGSGNDEA